jgi:Flp pilus assembly protein TadG
MKVRAAIPLACRRRRRSGSAMIELTLSLGFLIPLFLGTWQFGYAYYIYGELEQAVRDGARYASLQPYHSANATPTSAYLAAVQNVVVYGTDAPESGSAPIVNSLTTSNVGLTVTFNNNVPASVSVYITGYRMPAFFGSLTLNHKPLAWFPYVGMFGPP